MKRDIYRNLFVILCYCVFFILTAFILKENVQYIKFFDLSNLIFLVSVFFLALICVFLRGLVNFITFRPLKTQMTAIIGIKLAVLNTVGNYFPFSFGLIAKGIWLKKRLNITYLDFSSISLKTFIVSISTGGFIGICTLVFMKEFNTILLLGFSMMLLSSILLTFDSRSISFLKEKFGKISFNFNDVLPELTGLYVVFFFISGLKLFLALKIVGISTGYSICLLMTSGSMLTRIVSLTPANIGFLEAVVGGMAYILGIDFQMVVLAVGVERLADVIVNLALFWTIGLRDRHFVFKRVVDE